MVSYTFKEDNGKEGKSVLILIVMEDGLVLDLIRLF